MQNGAALVRQHRRMLALIIGCVSVAGVLAALLAANMAGAAKRAELSAAAGETLSVQAQALNGLMEKFRILPNLVARYEGVTTAFDQPDQAESVRTSLQQISALSGALDVVLYSADGQLLLTARDIAEDALPPASPILQAVLQGRLARTIRPFGERGRAYIFAHGARDADGQLIGIVAVLFDLGELEQVWSLSTNPVFAADGNGTILASNRPDWRMANTNEVFDGAGAPEGFSDYVRDLPQLGWTLHVLTDTGPIARAGTQAILAVGILAVGLAALLIALANRRLTQLQQQRRDRASALKLERLVRDRTRDLTLSNQALQKAQAELVQTGKMAALGQMSTALSHEFNQPLAATRNYADNAIRYLERGRTGEARENLSLIAEMADRMASISSHLRNFARKPNVAFGAVPIGGVIEDALAVLSARIRQSGAEISQSGDPDNVWVLGGRVRLQQVLVNLVGNALDVSEGQNPPRVDIATEAMGEKVYVHVRDYGPGVDEAVRDQIFDPFFTTKGPGDGLGLGLSISFNIVKDFGGRLTCENLDKGARFTIELKRGEPIVKAAE